MNRRLALRSMVAGAGSLFTRLFAEETSTFRSDVQLVLLDVSVRDGKGGVVGGLSRSNFMVFEDGRPQHITAFDNEDLPVTMGIVLDESRSMTAKRSQVLTAADMFIRISNTQDEMFVLHFNDKISLGLPDGEDFSSNLNQLRTALYSEVPDGKTALNDAVLAGLEHLRLGTRERRALVVITDGGDTASKHTRGQMLNAATSSLATIYTIGLYEPDDPDRDLSILRQLARISGGEAYFPSEPMEMGATCRRIANDMRTRYTIGYPAPSGGHALRHIHVVASVKGRSDLMVHARNSYRYDEIASRSRP
jgi:Ca-activated chloride channel homolog